MPKLKPITLRLPPELRAALGRVAEATGRTIGEVAREWLEAGAKAAEVSTHA